MIRNYIIIAWRNFKKNKTFSIINIVGLALGLACFLLIALYVLDELSYDRFNANADRIYRINSFIRYGGTELNMAVSSDMTGQSLKKDYPQVEQFTRIFKGGNQLIKKSASYINERKIAYVDSSFFQVFSFPSISGDMRTALNRPNTVVMSESAAKKYFGTTDILGRTIETYDDGANLFKVTGVIKDMPQNGHFNYDFLFSMQSLGYNWGNFTSHNFHTYLLLAKGTDYKVFEKNLDQYINHYVLPYLQKSVKMSSMEEFKKAGNALYYTLIPLTRIHLYSDLSYELSPNGNIQFVYIFSIIALFVLAIACVNFMNLTTARSGNRAKEVGIRKVLGTQRKELIIQFLGESTLMVILALLIAIGIAALVLPLFNDIAEKSMKLENLFSPLILPLLIILPIVVGLFAGSYPAFFLSSFKPIQVLKGRLKLGGKSGLLRSGLVVFQFTASILLIVGSIVIYRQLNYIQTKDIGFKKDQVLVVKDAYTLGDNTTAFKDEVLAMNGVISGTVSGYLPVSDANRNNRSFTKEPIIGISNGFNMENWIIDYDYIKTLGMELIKGRGFSREYPSDSNAVILNEAAVKLLGYEDPINKEIYASDDNKKTYSFKVIGIVKNFNYASLRQSIGPLGLFLGSNTRFESFKVRTADISHLLAQVEEKWKALAPATPFNYQFLDDSFNDMYRSEQKIGKIVLTFSVLAILIACLGLYGLATFMAEQRTKEIGIRKTLGATSRAIAGMLSMDFIKLVLVAFVLAIPIGWYFMQKWLQDFAYRIEMNWWWFGIAGATAIFIALLTVSFQSFKAALANPVKSLRSE